MTRKEAIEELKKIDTLSLPNGYLGKMDEALEISIESLQTDTCKDCISRTAVLAGLANIAKNKAKSDAQKAMMGRSMLFVECLPSVQPEQKGDLNGDE